MDRIQTSRALSVAAVAILAVASPVLALSYGPSQVLRTISTSNAALYLSDVAAADDGVVVVGWQELNDSTSRSYIRRSVDGGETFQTRVPLRGGGRAYGPAVASCIRGVYAVATWPTASGPSKIGVDFLANPGTPFGDDSFALPGARGVGPNVTCTGSWNAFSWFDTTVSPAHVRLRIQRITDACSGACITEEDFDLGTGRLRHGLSITMTETMAWVTWKPDSRIVVQRIALRWDGSMTATPRPLVTVLSSVGASQPLIAADGQDVALAYSYQGDTRVRYSVDRGQSFGGPDVLLEAPCTDCEAGSRPVSIDMLGPSVVVEAISGGLGSFQGVALVTDDAFATWTATPGAEDSTQIGALFQDGGVRLAEARFNTVLQDPTPQYQRIRYRTGLLP